MGKTNDFFISLTSITFSTIIGIVVFVVTIAHQFHYYVGGTLIMGIGYYGLPMIGIVLILKEILNRIPVLHSIVKFFTSLKGILICVFLIVIYYLLPIRRMVYEEAILYCDFTLGSIASLTCYFNLFFFFKGLD